MSSVGYFENYYSAWGGFDNSVSTANDENLVQDPKIITVKAGRMNRSNTNATITHDFRRYRYLALQTALASLAKLHVDDDFYLDGKVALKAAHVLGLISLNLDIEPPRLFPEDSEAAVFTWDDATFKRYLTVDSEEIDYLSLDKTSFTRYKRDMPNDMIGQLSVAMEELSKSATISRTFVDQDD